MKKITTILSPLVLLATTALAQDSTCILQPSCSQLGYTSSETDCGTQKVLRCPFDVSQVACLSGGSGAGGGDGGSGGNGDYNPNDPNNELGDVIAIRIDFSSNGNDGVEFTYGGGNIIIDCGNGLIVSGWAAGQKTLLCTYVSSGTYTVKISGDFTYYGGQQYYKRGLICPSCCRTKLLKLDKSGITRMSNVCNEQTSGIIPPLPSTLKDATRMFSECSSISSYIPNLPEGLEKADYMFFSSGVDGKAVDFSELPNLTSYTDMFASSGITQADNPSWPANAW